MPGTLRVHVSTELKPGFIAKHSECGSDFPNVHPEKLPDYLCALRHIVRQPQLSHTNETVTFAFRGDDAGVGVTWLITLGQKRPRLHSASRKTQVFNFLHLYTTQ
jgi:hypothetical protein